MMKIKTILLMLVILSLLLVAMGCKKKPLVDEEPRIAEQQDENLTEEAEPGIVPNATVQDEIVPMCPETCDDGIKCTLDNCGLETNFTCISEPITPCCNNSICEPGESPATCSADCAACEEDPRECYENVYNTATGSCVAKKISDCCGNNACDFGESCSDCEEDCGLCAEITDLDDYPGFLSGTVYIIVGTKGSGVEVFAASSIANSLTVKGKNVETKFTTDISIIGEKDSIFIGGPCTDPIIQDFFGLSDCTDFLEPDQAVIKVVEENGNDVIFVSGRTSADTKAAAEVLKDYGKYNLKGGEVMIDSSGSSPKII